MFHFMRLGLTTEGAETPVRAARKEACERIRFAQLGRNSPTLDGRQMICGRGVDEWHEVRLPPSSFRAPRSGFPRFQWLTDLSTAPPVSSAPLRQTGASTTRPSRHKWTLHFLFESSGISVGLSRCSRCPIWCADATHTQNLAKSDPATTPAPWTVQWHLKALKSARGLRRNRISPRSFPRDTCDNLRPNRPWRSPRVKNQAIELANSSHWRGRCSHVDSVEKSAYAKHLRTNKGPPLPRSDPHLCPKSQILFLNPHWKLVLKTGNTGYWQHFPSSLI